MTWQTQTLVGLGFVATGVICVAIGLILFMLALERAP